MSKVKLNISDKKSHLNQEKNLKNRVASYLHSSFLQFQAPVGGYNPAGHLLTLT